MWDLVGNIAAVIAAVASVAMLLGLQKPIHSWWDEFLSPTKGAQVDIEFQKQPSKIPDSIVLENVGDKLAEQVSLSLDASGRDNPIENAKQQKLPATIEPEDSLRLTANTYEDSPESYHATLTWMDSGEEKKRRKTIGK